MTAAAMAVEMLELTREKATLVEAGSPASFGSGLPSLPTLFTPTPAAANRTLEFFTAKRLRVRAMEAGPANHAKTSTRAVLPVFSGRAFAGSLPQRLVEEATLQ